MPTLFSSPKIPAAAAPTVVNVPPPVMPTVAPAPPPTPMPVPISPNNAAQGAQQAQTIAIAQSQSGRQSTNLTGSSSTLGGN